MKTKVKFLLVLERYAENMRGDITIALTSQIVETDFENMRNLAAHFEKRGFRVEFFEL